MESGSRTNLVAAAAGMGMVQQGGGGMGRDESWVARLGSASVSSNKR